MKKFPVKTVRTNNQALKNRLSCFPNAGPNPNITGMRRIWGESKNHPLFLVKLGAYLYNVSRDMYERV